MWYIPYDQPNICESPLANQYDVSEFSKLPAELKIHILKMTFGTKPGEVARGLANLELVSKDWQHLALDLWRLAAQNFFTPRQLEDARNLLVKQLGHQPTWREIYLSFFIRSLWLRTGYSRREASSPLYVPAGSHLRLYAENSGKHEIFVSILTNIFAKGREVVSTGPFPYSLYSRIIKPNENINKTFSIGDFGGNCQLNLACLIPYDYCIGFAQMSHI